MLRFPDISSTFPLHDVLMQIIQTSWMNNSLNTVNSDNHILRIESQVQIRNEYTEREALE